MGFAQLTAHLSTASPKNHAQRDSLQLDQSLELNRDFVIFAKMRMDPTAKNAAATMLRSDQIVACARQTSFATASENVRERPHFG